MDIPGYRDITEIGRGGASVVYRAEQEQFGRVVAVKVLTVGAVEDRLRRRFERECAATGRLTGHPNIVAVLDNGYTADGSPFITTALYAHGSLADRLDRDGALPLDEVLRIGVKVAGALEAVHRAEILHRDLKPSNLLESGYGEPALTGFGISAIDPSQQAMTMAQSFAPVHTPPEVVLGEPATEASDTYQLGSTLYTLLAGHAPFETGGDDGVFAMLGRIQEDEVPPIDRPDVPVAVVDVLRVAMAKRPEDRYPSTAALGEALQRVQADLGLPVTDLVTAVGPTAAPRSTERDHTMVLPAVTDAAPPAPAAAPVAPPPVPPAPVPEPASAAIAAVPPPAPTAPPAVAPPPSEGAADVTAPMPAAAPIPASAPPPPPPPTATAPVRAPGSAAAPDPAEAPTVAVPVVPVAPQAAPRPAPAPPPAAPRSGWRLTLTALGILVAVMLVGFFLLAVVLG